MEFSIRDLHGSVLKLCWEDQCECTSCIEVVDIFCSHDDVYAAFWAVRPCSLVEVYRYLIA
jgi:hypothetical protein